MKNARHALYGRMTLRQEMTLADNSKLDQSKKNNTQIQLQKLQRAEDGKKAMAEYEAEARAIRIKTEKLKALRLAKEAAVPAAPPKKVAAKAKPKAKAKKAKEAPLSDWLKDQQGSGRNN